MQGNFLFDFDGTLVDSSAMHAEAYRQALELYRPDLLESFDYHQVRGVPTAEGFGRLGVDDPELIRRLTAAKQQQFRRSVEDGRVEAMPGAGELLPSLLELSRALYLVTSGSARSVDPILQAVGFSAYFSGVVTSDDVPRGKPEPDPYLHCLAAFDLDPSCSVAVEDAALGVQSAHAAGLDVFGVHNPSIADHVERYFGTLADLHLWCAA
jgi:HAD superfamily hydrolase (TIGR01509 family)